MADPVTWQERGHCWDSDPNWFHSDDLKLLALGIELCGECPVVKQCLKEQERLNAPGIWGGVHWTTKGLETIAQPWVAA